MREGEVQKLENSTLTLVLCQVRFSPLERMDAYAPEIQDRLRKNGFPLNKSREVNELRLLGGATPESKTYTQWQFHSIDSHDAVILNKGFLTLQTTQYDTFDAFLERLGAALDVVHRVVDGLVIERVGLRYVNTFQAEESTWSEYVQQGIRGLESDIFTSASSLNVHQTTASTPVGVLAMRLLQNRNRTFLPPDLGLHEMPLPKHLEDVPEGALLTIVDVDHIKHGVFEYARDEIEHIAWKLKNVSYKLTFDEIFTDHAVQQWR